VADSALELAYDSQNRLNGLSQRVADLEALNDFLMNKKAKGGAFEDVLKRLDALEKDVRALTTWYNELVGSPVWESLLALAKHSALKKGRLVVSGLTLKEVNIE